MNELYADIILFDTVGSPYTGETAITNGMGGSEFQAILLLEEFAKLGKKVVCLNNTKVEKQYNKAWIGCHDEKVVTCVVLTP